MKRNIYCSLILDQFNKKRCKYETTWAVLGKMTLIRGRKSGRTSWWKVVPRDELFSFLLCFLYDYKWIWMQIIKDLSQMICFLEYLFLGLKTTLIPMISQFYLYPYDILEVGKWKWRTEQEMYSIQNIFPSHLWTIFQQWENSWVNCTLTGNPA